jgi:hypothetical protein
VRHPDKMMALALELDGISGLCHKVDTNHDIVYMEFSEQAPTLNPSFLLHAIIVKKKAKIAYF